MSGTMTSRKNMVEKVTIEIPNSKFVIGSIADA